MERLRKRVREDHLKTTEEAKDALKDILTEMLNVGTPELNLTTRPSVILVIGVNGVGKTTTIGKLATRLVKEGKKVLLVASVEKRCEILLYGQCIWGKRNKNCLLYDLGIWYTGCFR